MKIKTSEATPLQLNWLVAKCEGLASYVEVVEGFKPSTDWVQGGSIIERELIEIGRQGDEWIACINVPENGDWESNGEYGATPLIAAMRCYVASKLGDEVEIPEELK